MQMVEAGELALDDPAADHLPRTSTSTPTARRSANSWATAADSRALTRRLRRCDPESRPARQRVWTPAEVLELVLPDRGPPAQAFEYTNTNYLLLGLVIEQVRGRPLAEVLREGVLSIEGVERLIYQPDEAPTEPMAMPRGESTDALEEGGGYLPSIADATVDGLRRHGVRLAFAGALVAGVLRRRDRLPSLADRDGDVLRRVRTWVVPAGPPGAVGHGGEHFGYKPGAGA